MEQLLRRPSSSPSCLGLKSRNSSRCTCGTASSLASNPGKNARACVCPCLYAGIHNVIVRLSKAVAILRIPKPQACPVAETCRAASSSKGYLERKCCRSDANSSSILHRLHRCPVLTWLQDSQHSPLSSHRRLRRHRPDSAAMVRSLPP